MVGFQIPTAVDKCHVLIYVQLIPEVVRYPHFEVPYPQLKRGQQSLGALVAVVRPFRYIY